MGIKEFYQLIIFSSKIAIGAVEKIDEKEREIEEKRENQR